jgi:hypothetical protein
LSHLARLPFSMVGERAGIRMLMGIGRDPELKGLHQRDAGRFGAAGAASSCSGSRIGFR